MRLFSILVALVTAFEVKAHMPKFNQANSWDHPEDLGDLTKNSWSVQRSIAADDVHYFKFYAAKTPKVHTKDDKFKVGLYVPPGDHEKDFTFYVAFWGMGSKTKCEIYRRKGKKGKKVKKEDKNKLWRILVNRKQIPKRVHDWKKMDVLVFKASPKVDLPVKFEPFSPTVYKPRGFCYSDYPMTGTYYMAVWAAKGTKGTHHYTVGLASAERDTMKLSTTILFDYLIARVHMWNRWSVLGMIWPILVSFIVAQALLLFMACHPTKKTPSVWQWLVVSAASILFGNVIYVCIMLGWTSQIAGYSGPMILIQLIAFILLPLASSVTCFSLAFCCNPDDDTDAEKSCCCCCKWPLNRWREVNRRITVGLIGLFHLMMVHAGFIVAPVLLILAAIVPPKQANYPGTGCQKASKAEKLQDEDESKN